MKKHKGNEYEQELKRLDKEDILQVQKDTILRFHTHLRAKRNSDSRIVKLSWQLRKIAKLMPKPFEDATKEDMELLMGKIYSLKSVLPFKQNKPLSPHTKADYGRILKQFYKWLRQTKNSPDEVEWITTKLSNKDNVIRFDLITWSDINKLTEVANNTKDIAFINFLYETGARIGEVLAMKHKDVQFQKKYAKVRLNGKTGERWVPIVTSTTYLAQYISTKTKTDENNYLWVSSSDKNEGEPLQYAGATMLLRKLFKKAVLNKRCNPHSFRHSRATELAKTLTEPQLRLFFGWDRGSDTPSVYTHLSGRDVDNAVLKMNGLIDEDEKTENEPKKYGLCETINNPQSNFCCKCGYGLTTNAILSLEERKNKDIDEAMQYFTKLAQNPEKIKEFIDFKNKQ